jgi:hypothetical protein
MKIFTGLKNQLSGRSLTFVSSKNCSMKMKLILLLSGIFLAVNLHAQQSKNMLDGKTFSIQLMKAGTVDSKESLVFENGKMDPLQCHQYGFSATAYQGKNQAGLYTFKTVSLSEKEGTMTWQGKINGDQIDGTVVWTKKGQEPIQYTFKGTLDKSGK